MVRLRIWTLQRNVRTHAQTPTPTRTRTRTRTCARSPTQPRTHAPTRRRTHAHTHPQTTRPRAHAPTHPRTHKPRTHGPTRPRAHAPTRPRTHAPTHPRTNAPTHAYARARTCIHVHAHAHTHTHPHTHTLAISHPCIDSPTHRATKAVQKKLSNRKNLDSHASTRKICHVAKRSFSASTAIRAVRAEAEVKRRQASTLPCVQPRALKPSIPLKQPLNFAPSINEDWTTYRIFEEAEWSRGTRSSGSDPLGLGSTVLSTDNLPKTM